MQATEFIVWGGTGNYKVVKEIIESHGHRVIAMFDNNRQLLNPFPDIPYAGGREDVSTWLKSRDKKNISCVVSIGGKFGKDRLQIQAFLTEQGLKPEILIHQTAYVSETASLGPGTQVYAMASVCASARVGEACIINTAASVDHDCIIGNGAFLGPGARLAGSIVVEDYADIYTGAIILPRVRIGEGAVVGAGSVVLRDVEPYTIVAGNPARVIKKRDTQ
jgi:sugar O-acyltransferase (sialic acid O-acetyltransferase NeuD family)